MRARNKRKPYASGFVWPDTGSDAIGGVKAVFGGRLFPAHVATVGYDYDFHRGVDVPLEVGDQYLSPIHGHVLRMHRTHYEFPTTAYQAFWTEDDDGHGTTWSHADPGLTIEGTRGGSNSFPTCDKYINKDPVTMTANGWEIRIELSTLSAINGAVGFGFMDTATSEYITMEWDGSNIRILGARSGGNITSHNSTSAWVDDQTWLRIRSTGGNVSFDYSDDDGDTWNDYYTISNPTWTNSTQPTWRAVLYYRSKDTNATPDTATINYIGWYDDNTIPRFGNWVMVAGPDFRIVTLHLADVAVAQGDIVKAGQSLGTVGLTGFDDRSGRINAPHVHLEYMPGLGSAYDQDDAINPLGSTLLPRENVSNNVSVTRSSATDPGGSAAHKLVITVTRADQDFDINEFSLTGNLATRTVNWNTRAGLNVDADVPLQDGVYFEASAFNGESASYTITVYFRESTVGTVFQSAYVKDCDGNSLWTESINAFPTTSSGLMTALGISTSYTVDEIFACQESSGNLTGAINSWSAVKNGTISYQQTGPTTAQKALTCTQGTNGFYIDRDLDIDTGPFVFGMVFKITAAPSGVNCMWLGLNRNGQDTDFGTEASVLLRYPTAGSGDYADLFAYVNGTPDTAPTLTRSGASRWDNDGSWHVLLMVRRGTSGTGLKVFTDDSSVTTATATGFYNEPIGNNARLGWMGGNWNSGGTQAPAMAVAYAFFSRDSGLCQTIYDSGSTIATTWRGRWT